MTQNTVPYIENQSNKGIVLEKATPASSQASVINQLT